MKYTFKIISFVLITIVVSACKNKSETEDVKKAPISVTTARVQQTGIKEYLTFNGVTQYQKKESIRANVTGYISRMNFEIGGNIRKGQVFAYVRTKEQDALKDAIKIDSSLAKFSHPITITSNASGVISTLNVQQNDYVAEGDTLCTIVVPNSLVIQVNVPYEYRDAISIGTSCEIVLANETAFSAKITGVLPMIDPMSQSQTFLIALPNKNLPENLKVQVKTIFKEETTALVIPTKALQTNELLTEFWVMKIKDDTLALKQKVSPLLREDSLIQIQSPEIKVNDLVITEGSYQMQDSTIVSIKKQ